MLLTDHSEHFIHLSCIEIDGKYHTMIIVLAQCSAQSDENGNGVSSRSE